jgi:DNA-binding Lrp family transcriptional regulator
MKIEKDSRQVPKTKDIMANAKYCDILYCYFQNISTWDGIQGHPRVFSKRDKNFSKISEYLKISRQTVSKKFNNLVELGLIKENKDTYELIILEEDIASLIPINTLKILVSAFNENAISVYVYLLNRYYATLINGQQEFIFTKEQLKGILGFSTATRSNDYIIDGILTVLQKIGVIKVETRTKTEEFSGDVKSYLYLVYATNQIEA